ncbi:hypothetical protein, partial [Yoonia sp. R2-816]|uniref:hypothetical protein n=1 Tax=Yoonia sp. R2-816 TaxID=3342638 RepID=UPI003727415D
QMNQNLNAMAIDGVLRKINVYCTRFRTTSVTFVPSRVTLGDHHRLLSRDCFIWTRWRSYPSGDHSLRQWPEKPKHGAKLGRSAEADRALVWQSLTQATKGVSAHKG